jgi:hypothetical protein
MHSVNRHTQRAGGTTGRPGSVAWPLHLSRFSRWTHKWLGALLALIMVVLSLPGVLLAFKHELEYL